MKIFKAIKKILNTNKEKITLSNQLMYYNLPNKIVYYHEDRPLSGYVSYYLDKIFVLVQFMICNLSSLNWMLNQLNCKKIKFSSTDLEILNDLSTLLIQEVGTRSAHWLLFLDHLLEKDFKGLKFLVRNIHLSLINISRIKFILSSILECHATICHSIIINSCNSLVSPLTYFTNSLSDCQNQQDIIKDINDFILLCNASELFEVVIGSFGKQSVESLLLCWLIALKPTEINMKRRISSPNDIPFIDFSDFKLFLMKIDSVGIKKNHLLNYLTTFHHNKVIKLLVKFIELDEISKSSLLLC